MGTSAAELVTCARGLELFSRSADSFSVVEGC